MDKNIRLVMGEDKNISIYVDGSCKLTIDKDKRIISAKDIYELVDYSPDAHYLVIKENPAKLDEAVLDELVLLFGNICSSLNEL